MGEENKDKKPGKGRKSMVVFLLSSVLLFMCYAIKWANPDALMVVVVLPLLLVSTVLVYWSGILHLKAKGLRRAMWWFVVLFPLFLSGDHIVGLLYFKHLCATKAGGHIYKTIDLPEMPKWEETGMQNYNAKYDLRYVWDTRFNEKPFNITSTHITLHQGKELLSENRTYQYFGGWFAHALALGHPGEVGACGDIGYRTKDALTIQGVLYSVIRKQGSKQS